MSLGHHSDPRISQHIESDSTLLANLEQLTAGLSNQLAQQFGARLGVPMPTATEATVRSVDYALVSSVAGADQLLGDFVGGAMPLLVSAFSSTSPVVAPAAQMARNVVGQAVAGGSAAPGSYASARVDIDDGQGRLYVAACLAEVASCSGAEWGTVDDFVTAYYAFVVWLPSADAAQVIRASTQF